MSILKIFSFLYHFLIGQWEPHFPVSKASELELQQKKLHMKRNTLFLFGFLVVTVSIATVVTLVVMFSKSSENKPTSKSKSTNEKSLKNEKASGLLITIEAPTLTQDEELDSGVTNTDERTPSNERSEKTTIEIPKADKNHLKPPVAHKKKQTSRGASISKDGDTDSSDDVEIVNPPPAPVLLPLPSDAHSRLQSAVNSVETSVLFRRFNIDFYPATMARLLPGRWLDDEIINSYLMMIAERNHRTTGALKIFTHNSFFTRLKEERQDRIPRNGNPLSEADLIFFPLHMDGNHWALAVMNREKKTFHFYDSLQKNIRIQESIINPLRRWVNQQYIKKEGKPFDWDGWSIRSAPGAPQQNNGFDCGIYVLVNAEQLSRRLIPNLISSNVDYYRLRIAYELITNRLLE